VRIGKETEKFPGKAEGIPVVRAHGVVFQHGEFGAVEAARGFPVAETFADLVQARPVPGDKFFHPDLRGGDEPEGLFVPPASFGGQIGGFKNLKAGFGNKAGGEEGSIRFQVVSPVKKFPDPPDDPGPLPQQFQVH
jgi:hypothetical protein